VHTGQPVNFHTLVESARRRGETALGYRLYAENGIAERSYGIHINPKKSEMVAFDAHDKLIVVSDQ